MAPELRALGLDLEGELPDGAMAVEVVVVAKMLDEHGAPALWMAASAGLSTWEAAGMAQALADRLREATVDLFREGGDNDG